MVEKSNPVKTDSFLLIFLDTSLAKRFQILTNLWYPWKVHYSAFINIFNPLTTGTLKNEGYNSMLVNICLC